MEGFGGLGFGVWGFAWFWVFGGFGFWGNSGVLGLGLGLPKGLAAGGSHPAMPEPGNFGRPGRAQIHVEP